MDLLVHYHAMLIYKLENLDQCFVPLHVSLKNINFAQSWFPCWKRKVNERVKHDKKDTLVESQESMTANNDIVHALIPYSGSKKTK